MISRRLTAAALLTAGLCVGGFGSLAGADEQDADFIHAQGAVPASEEAIKTFATTPTYRAFLPDKVDLSSYFPKPRDQGDQGSCVGWAVGYAARAYYSQAVERKSLRDRANIPSPAYIYNSVRGGDCDSGSKIHDALDLLKKGSLSLKAFPYSDKSCRRPSPQQEADASGFRIVDWRYIDYSNPDQVKGELAQGNPVIISMKTQKGFHRLRGSRIYDRDDTASTGFHAITVTGYDERKQAFRLINSWGTRWGDHGYGWMSYDAFRRDVREAYSIRVDAPPPEPEPVVFVPVPQPKPQPGPQPEPGPAPAPEPHVEPVQPVNVTGLECGHVQIVRRDGKLVAKGFVGSSRDMQRLEAQLAPQKVANEVELRPWPQCEVLLTLDKELSSAQKPEIVFTQKEDDLQRDKLLVFDIRTPAFPSYLHIAYIQADGSVVHLRQSDATRLQTLPPGTAIHLGDGTNGSPKFRIAPPYGREMMVAIASKSPLFGKPRPQNETEREFLTALRQAILASPDGSQKRLITANYQALKTGAGVLEP